MSSEVRCVALSDAEWQPFSIPGGNAGVDLCVLREEPGSRARTVFVRFPAGWERSEAGSYSCAEELVVVEGSVRIGEVTFGEREWALVPGEYPRRGTSTQNGAVALARFDGPARWSPGETGETSAPIEHRHLTPGGSLGEGSWITNDLSAGCPEFDLEVFAVDDQTWWWVPTGAPLQSIAGLCFCRCFPAGGPGE